MRSHEITSGWLCRQCSCLFDWLVQVHIKFSLQKLKQSGKFRHIGISGLPLNIFRCVLDRAPKGAVEVVLSYCHHSLNDTSLLELVPYLQDKGVGIISASPLSMGLLSGHGYPEWHPAPPELKAACAEATEVCKAQGKSIAQLALQYALRNRTIVTTLVGMSSVDVVRENVKSAIEVEQSTANVDEYELLQQVERILQPVKNMTRWLSGREENNLCILRKIVHYSSYGTYLVLRFFYVLR